MKVPIQDFFPPRNWPTQISRTPQKILTQGENLDPHKKNWPTQEMLIHTKIYLTHTTHVKIATHVKFLTQVTNILTHIAHAARVKTWPTQHTQPRNPWLPRNPRNLADSVWTNSSKCFLFEAWFLAESNKYFT